MTTLENLYGRMIKAMGVNGLEIPLTAVKFYKNGEKIPSEVSDYAPLNITLTSCQANKQASLGDVVLLTRENIGCIAAAITFGLIDQNEESSLVGPRVYTEIMRKQSDHINNFNAPSPKDFTEGNVYACYEADKKDFCLFGHDDVGRFRSREIARKAIKEMIAIQPPTMQGVFFFSKDFDEIEVEPDVIVLTVRPVELTRIAQAYQFNTGERVIGNMGPVRVVNSDLIVRPYLTGKMNFSSYCVGARLIAEYDANRLGIGMPFSIFKDVVHGMEDSRTGYPFHLYPGAADDVK